MTNSTVFSKPVSSPRKGEKTRGQIYDEENYCQHYNAEDHRTLGEDLAKVFYKLLIKNFENIELLENIHERYMN